MSLKIVGTYYRLFNTVNGEVRFFNKYDDLIRELDSYSLTFDVGLLEISFRRLRDDSEIELMTVERDNYVRSTGDFILKTIVPKD